MRLGQVVGSVCVEDEIRLIALRIFLRSVCFLRPSRLGQKYILYF